MKELDFNKIKGLRVGMSGAQYSLDFVKLYLTEKLWNLLVDETNRFPQQFFINNTARTYTNEWKLV